ncbi:group 1 truncated hemoglobin [Marinobacter sp. M3C]|uniref:group I truncated hemoglobin n=1 Tax=unclassified Marinobacter TaxID=83889 RepID=UPI00200EA1C7|nr:MULTISPECIES: group 1 truncated hemoglobin [unclassified Marinobacter]MCL1476615.1 group 1 truncated hemoglobin [Marinobacter sp.]MCL1481197.1 group 1 truncated hemoglobin [Marinobacter sp.]MCL1484672.1 group 1 truncated hemoglobin [Marinobacter sp.]UQG56153.1 group 1 truncated hemoglobin [Marinobacter sp. M4C]UQG58768.1 group 1 truncated hemoglobin [Marinobacter sp. M3C]
MRLGTMKTHFAALVVLASLVLTGCQSFQREPDNSLYLQLGERAGIADVVEDLLYLIVDDTRISHQFKGINVAQFHRNLTDQLCELSGGPCQYSGREMRESHAAMGITNTQFNALAENLILAMEENDVPTAAQNRLIKKLLPMYPDIRNL